RRSARHETSANAKKVERKSGLNISSPSRKDQFLRISPCRRQAAFLCNQLDKTCPMRCIRGPAHRKPPHVGWRHHGSASPQVRLLLSATDADPERGQRRI